MTQTEEEEERRREEKKKKKRKRRSFGSRYLFDLGKKILDS